VSPPNYRWWVW